MDSADSSHRVAVHKTQSILNVSLTYQIAEKTNII